MAKFQSNRARLSMGLVVALAVLVGIALLYRNWPSHLNVMNWDFYIGETTIPSFEEETGVQVRYTIYSSNEDAYAKIKASPGVFDIVIPSDYMMEIMREERMIQQVDLSRVPAIENIDPAYRGLRFDPDEYCVPYLFGTTGFAVNRRFVSEEEVSQSNIGWATLAHPKYQGRLVILDDMRFVLGSVLMELGHSPNTIVEEEIEEAVELLLRVKPNIRAFTADTGKDYLIKGDAWVGYAWNGDAIQVQRVNPNVEYLIPDYGSLRFQDGVCIVAGAPNEVEAYLFLNHLLNPEVSAEISNYTHYGNTNAAALNFVEEEVRNNQASFPRNDMMRKLRFVQDLGEDVELYEKAWERVKG